MNYYYKLAAFVFAYFWFINTILIQAIIISIIYKHPDMILIVLLQCD